MNLATWILFGAGVFLIYSAWKGNNPLTQIAQAFGVQSSKSPTLSTPRYGSDGAR